MTPEELNQLKAIAASGDTQKRLNELIAKHTPVRKVRDGFREPKNDEPRCLLWGDATIGGAYCFDVTKAAAYAKLGRCFEHRHNADMVAEQNRLMAKFIKWIDEHGAEARGRSYYTIFEKDSVIYRIQRIICDVNMLMPIKISSVELADQFIRENEADLKKYFANEETLRRTLYE